MPDQMTNSAKLRRLARKIKRQAYFVGAWDNEAQVLFDIANEIEASTGDHQEVVNDTTITKGT